MDYLGENKESELINVKTLPGIEIKGIKLGIL